MSFWFTKEIRKGLAKKLRICISEINNSNRQKKLSELNSILTSINETLNQSEFDRDDLPHILNGKLYRDNTICDLISLLPFLDQVTLNSVSTFFQTTVRMFPEESLPQYLIANPKALDYLFEYFDQASVATTAHIIIRSCVIVPEFAQHLFDTGVVGSFVKYLTSNDFDSLSTAFTTYEVLLMTHPEMTAQYFASKWQIFAIQFKQLMSSPAFLVQLNFLPILFRFITNPNCKTVFFKFLDDNENLQIIMSMLKHASKKVQMHAYSIFKLFVLNPHKAPPVSATLKLNKTKLIRFLKDFKIEDGDEDIESEKQNVIEIISELK